MTISLFIFKMINYFDSRESVYDRSLLEKYGFMLKIVTTGDNVAYVYFLNASCEVITKPTGVRCKNVTMNKEISIVNLNGDQCFLISWIDDYEILINDIPLKSVLGCGRRKHKVVNPSDRFKMERDRLSRQEIYRTNLKRIRVDGKDETLYLDSKKICESK